MNTYRPATQNVLAAMRDPATYGQSGEAVSVCETHISWVFLIGNYAYKMKKPLRLEFLDYSSLELRRQACLAELELNRRMSQDVYRSLAAVVEVGDGGLRVVDVPSRGDEQHRRAASDNALRSQRRTARSTTEPPDNVVEWLVRMRRLPDDRALQHLIVDTSLTAGQVTQLSERLAAYYTQLPPVLLEPVIYFERLRRHVQNNFHELLRTAAADDHARLHRLQHQQEWYLQLHHTEFLNRVRDGRVVDGHGDLRPDHIYFVPEIEIIDCLEFSAELRQVDVLDELSFLAMECERLGRADVGQSVISRYMQLSDDYPPPGMAQFYRAYRALVRAKVASIRMLQHTQTAASLPVDTPAIAVVESCQLVGTYLHLAEQFGRDYRCATVIVVSGLMGTGKSTVASRLAGQLEALLVQTDEVRRELFGAPGDREPVVFQTGRYADQQRLRVYDELLSRAELSLRARQDVVLDGTFLDPRQLQRVQQLAGSTRSRFIHIRCQCPDAIAMSRIQQRMQDADCISDARPEFYLQQKALAARLQENTHQTAGQHVLEDGVYLWRHLVDLDTTLPAVQLDHQIHDVIKALPPS